MLYSQTKERSNRFALALRIAIPFIFVLFFWGYTFLKIDLFAKQDLVLFLALTLAYVYYTFFMIYHGFNSSFIDQNTKTFTKEKISDIIKKSIKKQENRNIVMIGIKNLNEINQRYGFENLDQILRLFVIELEYFLKKKNLYNIPIGKYFDGYFLMLLDSKESSLSHILKEFELYISKRGINNIEINTVFSMLPNSYDVNLNSTISALFYKILDDENSKKIDINDYEKMIYDAIQNRNFILKFQTIKDNKFDKDMIYLIQKLKFNSQNIPKYKLTKIINQMGYEIKYDLEIIKLLFEDLNFNKIKHKLFIEISPVSIRNHEFMTKFFKLVRDKNIDPKKIVFEFFEESYFKQINKFKEIMNEYKKQGFCFALSHFGGQNSSLEYLKYLEVDYIIYDMEFSKNLNDSKFEKILQSIEILSKNLGIKTIIRFIDKDEIYDKVKKSGIDFLQGFCIDKPKNTLGEIQ